MDTTSLGKTTGSDPVEETEKAATHQSGSNDCVIDSCDLFGFYGWTAYSNIFIDYLTFLSFFFTVVDKL